MRFKKLFSNAWRCLFMLLSLYLFAIGITGITVMSEDEKQAETKIKKTISLIVAYQKNPHVMNDDIKKSMFREMLKDMPNLLENITIWDGPTDVSFLITYKNYNMIGIVYDNGTTSFAFRDSPYYIRRRIANGGNKIIYSVVSKPYLGGQYVE